MILVTGASGCLGSHLVHALLAADEPVAVLVLPGDRAPALSGVATRLRWHQGDILDPHSLVPALAGVSQVYHVAGLASPYECDRQRMFQVNRDGTRHLLGAAQAAGVRRFVHVSSIAAVGYPDQMGDERMRYNGAQLGLAYMHSKHAAEQLAKAMNSPAMAVLIACPAAVIASQCDLRDGWGKVMLDVARRRLPLVPSGGLCVVGGADLAQGLRQLMASGRPGERYILGACNVSHAQLIDSMARALRVRPPRWRPSRRLLLALAWLLRPLDGVARCMRLKLTADVLRVLTQQVHYRCDKAREELGFAPRQGLDEIVDEAAAWLARHLPREL